MGGASVELACAADGIAVHGSDAFEPLINFWRFALSDAGCLTERVRHHHPLSKSRFYNLQRSYHNLTDSLEQAAVFFALNRSSFSGTTLSGGMSPGHPRFTPAAIARLERFANDGLHVEQLDYREALARHPNEFLYLDPPYANGQRLYGDRGDMHSSVDHRELAALLYHRSGWVLSYNDCAEIRALYRGYRIVEPGWAYGMSGAGRLRSRELLIIDA